ncbi:MAG: response regulator, partial [bacterium]|nr:response regulator [bacterium]
MPKTVLIIEDEELIIQLLQKKLTKEGYNVLVARDGVEGLKEIKEKMPDLILLDIIMPRMDGFSVMEEAQKDKEMKKIPIIIVSNSGQPVELDKAQKLGARDWLIKAEFDPQ